MGMKPRPKRKCRLCGGDKEVEEEKIDNDTGEVTWVSVPCPKCQEG